MKTESRTEPASDSATRPAIDMSAAAVHIRLEELRALYKLGMSLKAAGKSQQPLADKRR